MTVYHGSEFVIAKPLFGHGKRTNDYGQGFYCTADRALAAEWSVTPLHDGFVNGYELDMAGLSALNLADVLKSRAAFDAISFVSASPTTRAEFLAKKERRDFDARDEFRQLKAQPFDASALYMLNILQERIGPDDPRIQ